MQKTRFRSKRNFINDQRRHLLRRAPGLPAAAVPRQMDRDQIRGEITLGLIEMRKAGLLLSVHAHSGRLQLELIEAPGQLRAVSWDLAATMVESFRHTL